MHGTAPPAYRVVVKVRQRVSDRQNRFFTFLSLANPIVNLQQSDDQRYQNTTNASIHDLVIYRCQKRQFWRSYAGAMSAYIQSICPLNLSSGRISMFSVNLTFDKTLVVQFCYFFSAKIATFGQQMCKYSILNLNTFAFSCWIAKWHQ